LNTGKPAIPAGPEVFEKYTLLNATEDNRFATGYQTRLALIRKNYINSA
jgi:hypothetical protein